MSKNSDQKILKDVGLKNGEKPIWMPKIAIQIGGFFIKNGSYMH